MIPKVHLPKPSKLSSISFPGNDSFDQCNTFSTVCSSQGEEEGVRTQVTQGPWSEYVSNGENGTGFLSESGCHSRVPASEYDNYLEKLYEDYLQLLKANEDQLLLDAFAESLLI